MNFMTEKEACKEYGKIFLNKDSLRQYERDKHKMEICKVCGESFRRKKALRNHMWFKHRNRRKRRLKRKKNVLSPLEQYYKLSEEEKQKIREKIEAQALIVEPKIYTDEERRDLLRDWRELGK